MTGDEDATFAGGRPQGDLTACGPADPADPADKPGAGHLQRVTGDE